MKENPTPTLALFAHERGDARVRKRVAALQAEGWEVQGWMFHRERQREEPPVFWDNRELGVTRNRQYLHRIWTLAKSLIILWKHRHRSAKADVFYAVNLDNALLAMAARGMSGRGGSRTPPLVLEVADVQPAMLGNGLRSQGLRALERWVLHRCHLLITTSPGFVRHYFEPVQGRREGIFLLENKLYHPEIREPESVSAAAAAAEPDVGQAGGLPQNPGGNWRGVRTGPVRNGRPWVIGYFGAFRCLRSIRLIRQLAEEFPDQLHFILRGYPSGADPDKIAQAMVGLPNLEYGGPYHYPDDLEEMYGRVDLNWTFDFADPSGNSAWLLPNRIYEGGFYGCPALADASTETGAWVRNLAAGWALMPPLEVSLAEFFAALETRQWVDTREHCLRLDPGLFAGPEDYRKLSAMMRGLAGQAPSGDSALTERTPASHQAARHRKT